MLRCERHKKILDLLNAHSVLTIDEICKHLFISESTARRDIAHLDAQGLLTRVYGGVSVASTGPDTSIPFTRRARLQEEAKKIIGYKASKYVQNGYVIIMDGSTSAHYIMPNLLHYKDLIIVTSSAKTAITSGEYNIKTFVTGGQMIPGSFSFIGQDAESMASRINADIMFFSCRGISEDGMLTDPSMEENNVRRIMLQRARQKVLLCDSSKIGKRYFHNLCHVSEIDDIVCDTELPAYITDMMSSAPRINNDK